MAKSLRRGFIIAVLAIGGWWLLARGRSEVEPGLSTDIDPAPFTNPAKDAQLVAQVVKPNGKDPPRKPNFPIILAEDLGYEDIEAYGTKAIRTPHLSYVVEGSLDVVEAQLRPP